jgi:transitional endoplasmic reticulum ATPase
MQEAFVASLLAIARKAKKEEIEVGVNSMDIVENMEGDWVGVRGESKKENQDDDDDGNDDDDDEDLDKYILWTEMKEQVAILRESIETTSSPR